MSAKRGRTDGDTTDSRLEISAEHEIGGRDPYAIQTLDDVAKDAWDEPEAYSGLDSTLGMNESDDDADNHVASASVETSAYERNEDADASAELSRPRRYTEDEPWDPRRAYSEEEEIDEEPVTDDEPDMGAVWASESINAPLFHAAELHASEADAQLPWELTNPTEAPPPSMLETLDVAELKRREVQPEARRISRPPPLPAEVRAMSDRRRFKTASGAMELDSQEVVYDGRFWEKRSVRRAGQVALASVVGIVLGWMAWGGPNPPPEDPNAAAQEPIVTALDADAGTDAGTEQPDAGTTAANDEEETALAQNDAPVAAPLAAAEVAEAPVPPTDDNTCAVLIHSKPAGASIWVDGQAVGKTPYRGKQPCGRANFTVKRENYKPLEIARKLRDDGLNKINLELERPTYRVQVTSSPSRAVVKVNGKAVGKTPLAVKLPGYTKAKIVIDKPGHKTWKRTMVPRDSEKAVKATLAPSKGKKGKKKKKNG